MAKNKVEFGISNLHVFTYTVGSGGTVTLGTPYHQPGAISFSPEQDSNENTLNADNIVYWSEYSEGPFNGDLEVALFDDEFKTQFLGYANFNGGGIAQVKNATKPSVGIAFEIDGDQEKRRAVFYNCSLGAITRSYKTIGDEKEPATETIPVTCTGDNGTGITKVTFKPEDTAYDTLFTAPPVPALVP